MRVIKNPIIPFKGFSAMTFLGIVWTRKTILSEKTLRHEAIHVEQEKELLYVGFWLWYICEFLFIRLLQYRFNFRQAYRNISFEKEAYENEHDSSYLDTRLPYAFERYL